jgi:hypothetical protein
MICHLRPALVVTILLVLVSYSKAVPLYDIELIGLYGLDHTAPDGSQFNSVLEMNSSGTVLGSARMYDAASQNIGSLIWLFNGTSTVPISPIGPEYSDDGFYSVGNLELHESGKVEGIVFKGNDSVSWIYDGNATHLVGLMDAAHVRTDGGHSSFIEGLNEAGQATGYSNRYSGNSSRGESSWYYDGSNSFLIGLTGPQYTYADGSTGSRPAGINAAGHVTGSTTRYSGTTWKGDSAWYFDGNTTVEIGLVDTEHTNNGYRRNLVNVINDGVFVAGTAERFVGGLARGQSAWWFDGTTTARIGFTDAAHTSSNGTQFSSYYDFNNSGQVVGSSAKYAGAIGQGSTAWIYNGVLTTQIGLTDVEHTNNAGARFNEPWEINDAGHVVGETSRHNGGSADLGLSVWHYDGSVTTEIGLEDAEHTRDDGYRFNSFFQMNSTGFVSGFADRFLGAANELGRTSWIYNGTSTVPVGLFGSDYIRDDGFMSSSSPILNEAGQAFGRTDRYLGGDTRLGREAWFYDPTLNQTIPLTLSMRSDGFADSQVNFLSGEGVAVGRYTLFDENDNNLGDRIFYFSLEDGLHDLGALVDGGLSAEGWEWLATAADLNDDGIVTGRGRRGPNLNNTYAYYMTPTDSGGSADFNGDGFVDAADYVLWRKQNSAGDGYDLWLEQFGTSAPGGGGSAVPEPNAVPMAIFGLVALAGRSRSGGGRHLCTPDFAP